MFHDLIVSTLLFPFIASAVLVLLVGLLFSSTGRCRCRPWYEMRWLGSLSLQYTVRLVLSLNEPVVVTRPVVI